MMSGGYTKLVCITLSITILAYLCQIRIFGSYKSRPQSILEGLLKAEQNAYLDPQKKVAVGYGSCQDLIVAARQVLMILKWEPPKEPKHHHVIETEDDFTEVFLYFFKHGAAAERHVNNASLFARVLQAAKNTGNAEWSLGGNAPIMAQRFAREGLQVLLAAHISPQLRNKLPSQVSYLEGYTESYDVHVIMEYLAFEKWGHYETPRANRFIIHNDNNNPHLDTVKPISELLEHFQPHLFIVSGLQVMDNYLFKAGERQKQLELVKEQLSGLPDSTLIHFEMASFTEQEFLQDLLQSIFPFVNSLGMNEQELANLHSLLRDNEISFAAEALPRVATVLDQMRSVFRLVRKLQEKLSNGRFLSRIHVHTLAFQAILTHQRSVWTNNDAAMAKAALTAYRHVNLTKMHILLDDSFSTSSEQNARRVNINNNQPVVCWIEDNVSLCVAPGLVCTEAHQTVGGGDNISAAGLAAQL